MNNLIYSALLLSNVQENLLKGLVVDKRVYKKMERVRRDLQAINKVINETLDEQTLDLLDDISFKIEKSLREQI